MSGEYKDAAENIKQKLNTVSPSFCLAKWNMVSLHLTNGKTHSCYHPPTHDIPLEGLDNNPGLLHNTPQKIEERDAMRRGERPKGCSYCWRIEDAGHTSDRHYRSSEWWNSPDLERIALNRELDTSIMPAYVEVNFNQACNFKCIYCSPHLSTTWLEEAEKYGPYMLKDAAHNHLGALSSYGLLPHKISQKDNPYVSAFWKWWPDLYKTLKIFRMTGGEPLMDNNTFRVLEYAENHPNTDLELSVTSNLCPPKPELFNKFVDSVNNLEGKIKHFSLFVSCDSVGNQAEYIRTGMDFDLLNTNVRRFLEKTRETNVTFINTFNILSIPNLRDFLKWILQLRREFGYAQQKESGVVPMQRIWFDIPILHTPTWLSIKLADASMIKMIEECVLFMQENIQTADYNTTLTGFKEYEIDKVKRNLDIMKQGVDSSKLNIDMTRFAQYVDELDRRRNTNFTSTFPELVEFYFNCKRITR